MLKNREMTVVRFVTAANEVTIGGFWMEHAKGELKTGKNHENLGFSSPCWEKEYMGRVFYAKDTIFDAFVQELLKMSIKSYWPCISSTPDTCSKWIRHICSAGV